MDKSILEKRIHDKAEERANKYFKEISEFFYQHEELVANGREGLVLKPIAENRSIKFRSPYRDDGSLFNSQDNLSKYTNWKDIRQELVEKYEKEETDNILSKLDSINYLLEGE
ncbi:hypothetical protein OSJ94_10505 [Levilactobacillus brevis]|uniref:hypothetical protein n=1 Tax=Levilactobacillus brevis TaxID=1580 RepID=UPI00225DD04C|nr:hypothetical protein [Levilactobacillus brevis]MCX7511612.1 hypothetical protein [Levilactobacillus brevis]